MKSPKEKVKEVEKIARKEADSPSIVHDIDHLRRTADGAEWLMKAQERSKKEQLLAYAAGWLHDIRRPLTNKVNHAQASAEKAQEVLEEAEFSKENIQRVVKAVRDHREKKKWDSPLHGSIYFTDKVFEGMGAFLIFRRCTWMGETKDYKGLEPREATIKHFEHRMEKHKRSDFPGSLSKLVEYQYKWQEDFLQDLKDRKEYALRLLNYCYNIEERGFERVIRDFNPQRDKEEEIKKEAVKYIKGKLFKKFESFIDQ